MHKPSLRHAFWHADVVTQDSIEDAYAFLRENDPDRRGASGPSGAEECFGRAADTQDSPVVSRCWMWLAACHGHPDAARQVAAYLEADARSVRDAAHKSRLLGLASEWHAKGAAAGPRAPLAPARALPDGHAAAVVDTVDSEPEPEPEGVVVVGAIGDATSREGADLAKRFASIANRPLPTRGRLPAPGEIAEGILERWPWAVEAASTVERHFAVMRAARPGAVKLPPILFVGPKGSGKSTLAEWLCRQVGLAVTTLPCGGVADAAGISAVTRSWTTTRPGAVPQAMAHHGVANPALVFDEIDKTTMAGSQNGSVAAALLSLIGAEESYDSCLMTKVDLRRVSFLATANDISRVDAPLLDRFRIVPVPAPGREHVPTLLKVARETFVRTTGVPEERVPKLSRKDVALVTDWFVKAGGSARNFYALYERIVSGLIMVSEDFGTEREAESLPARSLH